MSQATPHTERLTLPALAARKGKTPLVMLTAHSAVMTRLLDPQVDILLVGDSLGMVVYGLPSTLGVTLEMMTRHAQAVVRSSKHAAVIVDMPFGSYQASKEEAFRACAHILAETGCQAVKLEGGAEMVPTVQFLTERGIPVLAHLGLLPQHVQRLGGYRYQARTAEEQEALLDTALAMQAAGAWGVLLEAVAEPAARRISAALDIPTIGIGASPHCDGQVLVTEDMLGLNPHTPRFVSRFGDGSTSVEEAVRHYAEAVRHRHFPTLEHCFGVER